jgi:GTP diphosphokinase / guanosine-3',5'-bis(diphosphate) 3'-diphosphatase
VVEIVTGPVARPNPVWLGFVRTGKARSEVRHFLRTTKRQESVELGARLFAQAAAQLSLAPDDVTPERWDALAREAHVRDRDELLADIGLGRRLAAVVARQMALLAARETPLAEGETPRPATIGTGSPVVVSGTEGMALQIANCCNPIPGDSIVGHMRRDLGLVVHQLECRHAQRARRADPERWIDLQWAEDLTGMYDVNLEVRVINERGVLGRAAAAIAEAESNILNVHIEDEGANATAIQFKVQVQDRRHLARVVRSIRRINQVQRVTRLKSGRAQGPEES